VSTPVSQTRRGEQCEKHRPDQPAPRERTLPIQRRQTTQLMLAPEPSSSPQTHGTTLASPRADGCQATSQQRSCGVSGHQAPSSQDESRLLAGAAQAAKLIINAAMNNSPKEEWEHSKGTSKVEGREAPVKPHPKGPTQRLTPCQQEVLPGDAHRHLQSRHARRLSVLTHGKQGTV
jgi:hypothetical protein